MPRRKKVQPQKIQRKRHTAADYVRAVDKALDEEFGVSESLSREVSTEWVVPEQTHPDLRGPQNPAADAGNQHRTA